MEKNTSVGNKSTTRKVEMADKAFWRLIMPSVVGLFACMLCLISLTWAWFSESAETTASIQAANYYVEACSITDSASKLVSWNGQSISLTKGETYQVVVETNATANTIGYCEMKLGDTTIIMSKDGATFTLVTASNITVSPAVAYWGTPTAASSVDAGSYPILPDCDTYFLKVNGELLSGDAAKEAIEKLNKSSEPPANAEESETIPTEQSSGNGGSDGESSNESTGGDS